MVNIRIDVSGDALQAIKRATPAIREAVRTWRSAGGQLVVGAMREIIRSKQKSFGRTGFLSNSVQVLAQAEAGFIVGPTADYALFVDQPTRPHIIRPRNAKALAFPASAGGAPTRLGSTRGGQRTAFKQVGGRSQPSGVQFAQIVHHPGTKGMFFIDATAQRVRVPLTTLLESNVTKALKGAGL